MDDLEKEASGQEDSDRPLSRAPNRHRGSDAGQLPGESRASRLIAILTCHNRKELTRRCLDTYFTQKPGEDRVTLEALVVDDGSTDGTGDAIRATFPSARVVVGDGTLFWARGMQLAERHAVVEHPDFLLGLNDDVALEKGAIDLLLSTARARPKTIVVGGLVDPDSGIVTYSGVVRSWWHPLRTRLVEPGPAPKRADTFNGNVVLVPRAVYLRVGPIDGGFSHGHADFDYGFRARRAGCGIVVAPGKAGTCSRGSDAGTFADRSLPLGRRWQLMQSAAGLPMRSHARYLRRHGGWLGPVFWAAPYIKLVLSALAGASSRGRQRRA